MYNVLPLWDRTNRDALTLPAKVFVMIELRDQEHTIISSADRLISFNLNKSGDCLSGVLTQDTITFSIDNSDGAFSYDPENDVYQYAKVSPMFSFYDSINDDRAGIEYQNYYISNTEASGNKMIFTAKSLLGFMNEKFSFPEGGTELVLTGAELVASVITQAQSSNGVPVNSIRTVLDSSLSDYEVKLLSTDNYSYAEILQLVANAFQCVLLTRGANYIYIVKLGDVSEDYVLSEKISYEYPKKKLAEKTGDINLYYNHGSSYASNAVSEEGGVLTVTNPIVKDYLQAIGLASHIFDFNAVSRKRITGNFRADPKIELFDIIIVPNGNSADVCAVTKMNFTYNGGWRGTYEATAVNDAIISMKVCDLEMLKIKQIESFQIRKLSPNTVSDDEGNYITDSNGNAILWEGV